MTVRDLLDDCTLQAEVEEALDDPLLAIPDSICDDPQCKFCEGQRAGIASYRAALRRRLFGESG